MKKLRITVNDKVYEVVVQVLEDDERVPGANPYSPLPFMPPDRQAAAAPAPAAPRAPVTTPSGAQIKGDPNAILAPIAGSVQKVFVQKGARVEAKSPVVLLEAMKMDTYIYAPRDGVVSEVGVAPGDAVQVGDSLMRYQPEA
ncbi:MAG: biotin/lipoyl-containing protein [Vicinamibacterales bacterium]